MADPFSSQQLRAAIDKNFKIQTPTGSTRRLKSAEVKKVLKGLGGEAAFDVKQEFAGTTTHGKFKAWKAKGVLEKFHDIAHNKSLRQETGLNIRYAADDPAKSAKTQYNRLLREQKEAEAAKGPNPDEQKALAKAEKRTENRNLYYAQVDREKAEGSAMEAIRSLQKDEPTTFADFMKKKDGDQSSAPPSASAAPPKSAGPYTAHEVNPKEIGATGSDASYGTVGPPKVEGGQKPVNPAASEEDKDKNKTKKPPKKPSLGRAEDISTGGLFED